MTKRNLTLGSASGKLGSVVYMRRRGQQIARLLVPSPHNPRTIAQCGNRAAFANYVAQWRALKTYVQNTWRGVSRYGSRENAFYRHSRGQMPAITRDASRLGQFLPTRGLVTYGSLPVNLAYDFKYGYSTGSGEELNAVYFLNSLGASAPTTVEGLFSKMKNWGVGVTEGDIFHLLLYTWYIKRESSQPLLEPQSNQPLINHMTCVLSASNNTPILQALPQVGFYQGDLDPTGKFVCVQPLPSVYPTQIGDTYLCYAMSMWIERPSAPLSSRYSRSRFTFNTLLEALMDGAFSGVPVYDQIAATYQ